MSRSASSTKVEVGLMPCCGLPWTEHITAFDEHRIRVGSAHAAMLAELQEYGDRDATDIAVLTLHGPMNLDCVGCQQGGLEPDDPPWPCRTYRLVAELHKRVFVDTPHGVEMEKR